MAVFNANTVRGSTQDTQDTPTVEAGLLSGTVGISPQKFLSGAEHAVDGQNAHSEGGEE